MRRKQRAPQADCGAATRRAPGRSNRRVGPLQSTWAHTGEPSYVNATRNEQSVEQSVVEWITRQPDAAEGIQAYMQKRPVQWGTTGREEMPSFMATLFGKVIGEY